MNLYILGIILKWSLIYNTDPRLVTAVVATESNFKVDAIGPVGEIGLMQLRPKYFPGEDLRDVETNIKLGVKHLSEQMKRCKHKMDNTSLICYNLGVVGGNKVKYPKKWPYYKKVMANYKKLSQHPMLAGAQ